MNTASLLSDLELARLADPGVSEPELIRRLTSDTIRELGLSAPIDPKIVASFRDIADIEVRDQPWAGCLIPVGNKTIAYVRASDTWKRRRFSAFHEITHTFLPGFALPQYRCDPAPVQLRKPLASDFRISVPDGRDQYIESLADLGASELLFPREEFLTDLDGERPDLDLVEALATQYEASQEATAIRVADLVGTDALVLCMRVATKPSEPNGDPRLRVKWSHGVGNWPFVPPHKSTPMNGPFERALEGEQVDEWTSVVGLSRTPLENVHVSARVSSFVSEGGHEQRRVLALITRGRKGTKNVA